ncbi:ATP-binding cassette domain-containing protein, partial [Escherichia coli]|nr:ATP-binding cassette domain-containing protein [Escherichia coli]
MLETKTLTLHYGGSQILYDIDMVAETGKITCVMGTNGVGKTSLLKALSGTHHRSGGDIVLNGETLARPPAHHLAHKGVGYVPQGRMIFPLLTVSENMETAYACLPRGEHMIPDEIYELFPVLKEMQNRRGGDLSGGQQQQLAIARAMIT